MRYPYKDIGFDSRRIGFGRRAGIVVVDPSKGLYGSALSAGRSIMSSPDEPAGTDTCQRAFLIEQRAFEHEGLFDLDVLVIRQNRAVARAA
jgi:hypothetical protein